MQKKGESQTSNHRIVAMDVVGFGENSVDLIATVEALPSRDGKGPLQDLTTLVGGQIATAMTGCARLGLSTRYIGTFGADTHGELVTAALRDAHVDTSFARTIAAPTRTALILVETTHHSRIVLARRDDALDWDPETLPVEAVADAKILLVDATDVAASARLAEAARAAGGVTVADVDGHVPGLDRLLRLTDVLVVSATFTSDLRHLHRESGARVVIATLGEHGAVAWDGTKEHHAPGFVVPVVDTTGAGDAFRAGLIAALAGLPDLGTSGLRTLDWPRVLEFANACAALNCRGRGAQAGLPTRAEVDTLVTSPGVARSKGVWETGSQVSPSVGGAGSGDRP